MHIARHSPHFKSQVGSAAAERLAAQHISRWHAGALGAGPWLQVAAAALSAAGVHLREHKGKQQVISAPQHAGSHAGPARPAGPALQQVKTVTMLAKCSAAAFQLPVEQGTGPATRPQHRPSPSLQRMESQQPRLRAVCMVGYHIARLFAGPLQQVTSSCRAPVSACSMAASSMLAASASSP